MLFHRLRIACATFALVLFPIAALASQRVFAVPGNLSLPDRYRPARLLSPVAPDYFRMAYYRDPGDGSSLLVLRRLVPPGTSVKSLVNEQTVSGNQSIDRRGVSAPCGRPIGSMSGRGMMGGHLAHYVTYVQVHPATDGSSGSVVLYVTYSAFGRPAADVIAALHAACL